VHEDIRLSVDSDSCRHLLDSINQLALALGLHIHDLSRCSLLESGLLCAAITVLTIVRIILVEGLSSVHLSGLHAARRVSTLATLRHAVTINAELFR